jgi:hypothetical protein
MAESMVAAVPTPILCSSISCGSIAGSAFGTATIWVRIGNVISVSKRGCRRPHGRGIRYVRVAAAPPEDCWGAWGYLERLEHHRLSPPLDALGVVAQAISTLLAAEPQTSVREARGGSCEVP